MVQPATFQITPADTGPVPDSYSYQVNGGPPSLVDAASGTATITLVPRRFSNTLTVSSLLAHAYGGVATLNFNAAFPPTADDADLNGDGAADLLAVGGTSDLPPGLWLAPGDNTGTEATASNIGVHGTGFQPNGSSGDFNGTQVISGHFTGGPLQDVLVYDPVNEAGAVIDGTGDGTPLQAQLSSNAIMISVGMLMDNSGYSPRQLANAGDSAGQGIGFPDLIAINGDSSVGYYLDYYPNWRGIAAYFAADQLSTATPSGDMNWSDWTIATAQVASGTAMFLWNKTTGALYLWRGLHHDLYTDALTYTQYVLANGVTNTWNQGAAVSLQAADINGDDTPDLWTVGPDAIATAWLVTDLTAPAGTGSITAQPSQTLTLAG
jgi:hypothetical protein